MNKNVTKIEILHRNSDEDVSALMCVKSYESNQLFTCSQANTVLNVYLMKR